MKTNIIKAAAFVMILTSFILITSNAYAIPVWTSGSNMPFFAYHSGSFSYVRNDTGWVFIIGGSAGPLTNLCQRYNVNTDTWLNIGYMPAATGIHYTSGAVINDTGYICGGLTGTSLATVTDAVYAYNIITNSWTTKAIMPAPRAFVRAVSYQDSLIYVAGGFNASGTAQSDVFLYNSRLNSWRSATPLPGSRMGGAFARSGDTLIYINGTTGTFNGTVMLTTYRGIISQSNRSNITWTTGASYPGTGRYRQDAQNWGCRGIIISGGASAAGFTPAVNECYVYSPGLNVWTQMPPMPTNRTAHMTGSVRLANNVWKFVNISGYNGSNVFTTEILTDTLCEPLGIKVISSKIPESFFLYQNYPNPFNPETKIKFSIPPVGAQYIEPVQFIVYNAAGREIEIIVSNALSPGTYEVTWDGTNFASGVYYYRLQAGGFTETRKMILLK